MVKSRLVSEIEGPMGGNNLDSSLLVVIIYLLFLGIHIIIKLMSIMVAGLYDALKSAGAKDELARKAAEEVAGYESNLAEIRSDLKLVKWMLGFNLAVSVTVLFQVFSV